MADHDTITEDEQTHDQDKNWKALREANEHKAKELEAAKRELAFLKAGVDVDSKAGQLLMKAYDGELDAEAIRKEAVEIGAVKQTEPEQQQDDDPVFDESERQSTALRQDVVNEGRSDEAPIENVYEVGKSEFERDLKNGDTQDTALAKFISKVNYYAQSTDPRMQAQVDVRPLTEQMHREARQRRGHE